MNHDPHIGFVIAAYSLALVIVAGMVVTIIEDYMNLKRTLSLFDTQEGGQDRNELNRRDLTPRSADPKGLA